MVQNHSNISIGYSLEYEQTKISEPNITKIKKRTVKTIQADYFNFAAVEILTRSTNDLVNN